MPCSRAVAIAWAIEPAGNGRQNEEIEGERESRERDRLPPREPRNSRAKAPIDMWTI